MSRRKPRQLTLPLPPDPKLAEALRDAKEILEWTLGPNPPIWRIIRLAKALRDAA